MELKGKNITIPEDELLRAMTDPTASPFTVYTIQELEDSTIITTPNAPEFTPMLTMLRGRAVASDSIKFEWNESPTDAVFSGSLYDGYTADANQTSVPVRKDNYIMPLRRIAKVSKFLNSFKLTDVNAMKNELRDRLIELKRSIEYYIWNGSRAITTPIQQTDGIKAVVLTAISNKTVNGTGVPQELQEKVLQDSIAQVYATGNSPTLIACTPIVASRIANFSRDNMTVRPMDQNGIRSTAFTYLSAFGFELKVVPVLDEFVGNGTLTGDVFVLDESLISLRIPVGVNDVINSDEMGLVQHGISAILYSYMGVEVKKALIAHRKITDVLQRQ